MTEYIALEEKLRSLTLQYEENKEDLLLRAHLRAEGESIHRAVLRMLQLDKKIVKYVEWGEETRDDSDCSFFQQKIRDAISEKKMIYESVLDPMKPPQ